ncbi:CRISPR/Cas system endoribonuclease Cas6 (RAMP superfamily) [Paraburkholderia sp. GAS199]|uniref:hypothetical protein n=1 Tax=Paraburkholderia sp. GAS199 TaxID=3035126 RepID=UPI003D1FAF13
MSLIRWQIAARATTLRRKTYRSGSDAFDTQLHARPVNYRCAVATPSSFAGDRHKHTLPDKPCVSRRYAARLRRISEREQNPLAILKADKKR